MYVKLSQLVYTSSCNLRPHELTEATHMITNKIEKQYKFPL